MRAAIAVPAFLYCLLLGSVGLCGTIPAGATVWYDAGTLSALADGSGVEQWTDSSASGFHLNAGSEAPVYRSAPGDVFGYVDFSASDQRWMQRTDVPSLPTFGATSSTVFAYLRADPESMNASVLGWGVDPWRYIVHSTVVSWAGPRSFHFQHGTCCGVPGTDGQLAGQAADDFYGHWHLLSAWRDGAHAWIAVDGVPVAESFVFAGEMPGGILNTLFVGKDGFGNKYYGDVAEIVIYPRALSAEEVAQANGYFGERYGASIPEPGTWSLMMAGALVAAVLKRRICE